MGDMRRPSFVKGATDRALQAFGVTHKSIFTGGISSLFLLFPANYIPKIGP